MRGICKAVIAYNSQIGATELKTKTYIKMRIFHCSDSHSFHREYVIPDNIDVICHTGDATNYRDPYRNHNEFLDFIEWYSDVPITHKIYVAGNHDSFIYHNRKECLEEFKKRRIIYLDKEEVVIDGVKFYGDPTSPRYGDWCFMAKRESMYKHWNMIPKDVNVLLTHTPPRGILDLSLSRDNFIEMCGCISLLKTIETLPNLKLHCFGHIHNTENIINIGTRKIKEVLFSNSAGVEDGKYEKGIIYNGTIIEI